MCGYRRCAEGNRLETYGLATSASVATEAEHDTTVKQSRYTPWRRLGGEDV
jgi:hypothetical protein